MQFAESASPNLLSQLLRNLQSLLLNNLQSQNAFPRSYIVTLLHAAGLDRDSTLL